LLGLKHPKGHDPRERGKKVMGEGAENSGGNRPTVKKLKTSTSIKKSGFRKKKGEKKKKKKS